MAKRKASARPTVEARAKHLKDLCADLGGRVGAPAEKEKTIYVSTGVDTLDVASGVGGFRMPGHIILHGRESCIAEGTHVSYQVVRPNGTIANAKGGLAETLFERFHQPESRQGKGARHRRVKGATYLASSLNEEDRVFSNPILDVVETGTKDCFEVKTDGGLSIVVSSDQRFYVGDGYRSLEQLSVGDAVMVHIGTHWRKGVSPGETRTPSLRKYLFVRNHPVAGQKLVRDKARGYENVYYRLARSRAVVEAGMNGLSLEEYVGRLNAGDLADLRFLDRDQHVHHKDEDWTNDHPSNLVVMLSSEHGRQHAKERHNNLRFTGTLDRIASIVPVGPRRTFDVKVAGPHHNYTANNFVLHNCGKTTAALSWCQQIIENDGYPLYLDVERKLNFKYAAEGGVDLNSLIRPKSIPRSIEAAMFYIERFIVKARALSATAPIGIVFDSMQAMVAGRAFKQQEGAPADQKKAYEAAWQDEARAYSVGFRLLNPILSEYGATICWISQVRADIGAGYAGAESIGVGKAPRFYASQILVWKKVTPVKIGSKSADGISGIDGLVKYEKNQDGRAFTLARVPIRFGEGIDRAASALYAAMVVGLAKKRAGGWYRLNVLGEEFDVKGVAGVREFFVTEPETFAAWRQEIRALVGQVELQVDADDVDGDDEGEPETEETNEGEPDGD